MKSSSLFLAIAVSVSFSLPSVFAADKAPVLDKSSCEAATYPKAALMNEESGTVSVAVLVSTDAKVVEVKIDKSSGSKTLDKAASKIYSTCKYSAGQKDGKPEQGWAKVDHVWSLS
ncbi:MAG: energy transducer TonB [Agitococcus sp.]|nr:energy transducer TonB [Agitococcus sp.]